MRLQHDADRFDLAAVDHRRQLPGPAQGFHLLSGNIPSDSFYYDFLHLDSSSASHPIGNRITFALQKKISPDLRRGIDTIM
jgi:hypothetical protein